MRRIAIVGCSGGGKSALAVRLGERLGVPVIHVDALFWKPGWTESGTDEFRAKLAAAVTGEAWIADGNFPTNADVHFPLADTIIWVDQPRLKCLRRAVQRALFWFGRARPDLAPGCPEQIDLKFWAYIWTWDRLARPRVQAAIDAHAPHATLIRLHSDREIAGFVEGVG
ncbi:MAG: hypothetical protein ACHP84_02995 [Caulobacterales bacterium]